MAKKGGDGEDTAEFKAVFVDTSLDTHLAIPVSLVDTIFDLKVKILTEHSKLFQNFGEIEVHNLKVKRKGKLYSLPDLMPVRSIFSGSANDWIIFADISSQCKTVDYNTEFVINSHTQRFLMLPDSAQFQRSDEKDEGNLGNARSEDLQVVGCFKSDDNFRSSSSDTDRRLNALVENIYNASQEERKPSGVLAAEGTSVNPVSRLLDVGSVEMNNSKKRRNSEKKRKEIESADKDPADATMDESDEPKGSTEMNDNGVTGLGDLIQVVHTDTDAPVNGSDNALAAPVDVQFKGSDIIKADQSKCLDKAVVSDSVTVEKAGAGTVGENLVDMDQARTEELGMLESLPDVKGSEKEAATYATSLESGKKRSKKRKHSEDDVSHQLDIKGSEETVGLGVPDVEDVVKGTEMLAEFGMTRPSKRKKTGDDLPDLIKVDYSGDEKSDMLNNKAQNQTKKPKNETKQKQPPAVKNNEFSVKHQSDDTTEPENSKSTLLNSASEKDGDMKTVSSPSKQMDQVLPAVTSIADIEMGTKVGVTEVLTNVESDVKSQQEADQTVHNDSEPVHLTPIQNSVEGAKSAKKRLSKKTKQNQNIVPGLGSEAKKDSKNSLLSSVDRIDNVPLISASQAVDGKSTINQGNKVIITNRGSDVNLQQVGDDNCQNEVEPTQVKQPIYDTEDSIVQTKKKTKQQQTRAGKSHRKVHGDQDDSRDDISLGKDLQIASTEVSLYSAKNKGIEKTSSVSKEHTVANIIKTKDGLSHSETIASARVENRNDSRTSSSQSDILKKSFHQGKSTKEFPKLNQNQSRLSKTSNTSTKKTVQNPPKKKSLMSKSSSIFSSSSEDEGGEDASNSGTETPHNDHVPSSDDSEDESKGSWASPKQGLPYARGSEKKAATGLESSKKRSKKRTHSGDNVSHQLDIKESEEIVGLGVPDVGNVVKGTEMLAEFGTTSKRKKTVDDLPDVNKVDYGGDEKSDMLNSKAQNQTKKSKKKSKQKQPPVVKNPEFSIENQSDDSIEPEKSKSTLSNSAAGKDCDVKTVSSPSKQMDQVLPAVTSVADIEMGTKVGVTEVLTNAESDVKSQQGADQTVHKDAEPVNLTPIQNNVEGAKSGKKRPSKKTKQNQNTAGNNVSASSAKDQSENMKHDSRQSTVPKSAAEYNDENLTSCQKAKKDNKNSFSSPVDRIDNVPLISASQADDGISTVNQGNKGIITNHGSDVNLQQVADVTGQNEVEPIQLTQVKKPICDTEDRSVKTKKKTMQQQTRAGKSHRKVQGDQDDRRDDNSLGKDLQIASTEVSLDSAKNKGIEKTSSVSKRHTVQNIIKTKDGVSHSQMVASARVENRNDSRTSSSQSDTLNKRFHQGKPTKELPKLKQNQSRLSKASNTSTKKVLQSPPKKKSLISKSSSIFEDESSSSSEDEGGEDAPSSSTETRHDDHVSSSDDSEDESKGSWASPKQGNSRNGGSASDIKSVEKNLTVHSILKSSQKYKKAKISASPMQLEDDDSQAVVSVPDSQAN